MAFGGGGVVAEVGEEIACPICFEEFEEPKCLPSCAHNVCYQCLKGMTKTNSKNIECPVCRKESKIPSGGVAGFPKNHLLARLIEGIPGRKEKKVISKALKDCKEKMEVLRSSLTEMNSRFETTRDRAEKMREEVKSAASLVVDLAREQEKDLLGQIDRYMSENHCEDVYSKHRENLSDVLAQGSSCTKSVQELLDRDEVSDLKELQQVVVEQLNEFVEASETRIFWAEQDTKPGFGLTLLKSEAVQNFIQEGSLGTIQRLTGAAVAPQTSPFFDQSGRVIKQITNLDVGQTEFSPFAVAVSKDSGNLAVLDESRKRVYIMNLEGEKQANNIQIQYGDLWDIAYSKDDEVVVVNRNSNRLLHYSPAGKFERKVVHAPNNDYVKFTFLSVDSGGRYLVTSAPRYEESTVDTGCLVCVYSPDRECEMIFEGEGKLSSPKKAIWHSGSFFVPDSDRNSIVVFDEDGSFQREIGHGVLTEPAGIAIDSENENILVCDHGSDSIQIFKTSGTFVTKFNTERSPVQIALSKDGKKIVLCSEGSCERCLQILSYVPTF